MAHVTIGKLYVSPDAKQWVDPDDLANAMEKHRNGDCGEGGLGMRLRNASLAANGEGFESVHTDRRGNEFFILSDHGADPKCTCVDVRHSRNGVHVVNPDHL